MISNRGSRIYSAAGAATRLALILSILFGCTEKSGAQGTDTVTPNGGLRVLFLGNSLTYSNDIPLIVKALAKSAGKEMFVRCICYPNYNFEDQWNHGEALQALAGEKWDFVVMQQGPSSLPESGADLTKWATIFAPKIKQAGARQALYMVWPTPDRIDYFDDVREHYSATAYAVKGMFIPAGEAWRAAWRRDAQAPLLGFDQFHPSVAGSYTAALSIYGMLYGRAPQGLPAKLTLSNRQTVEVPAPLAKLLQEAATEANQKYGRP